MIREQSILKEEIMPTHQNNTKALFDALGWQGGTIHQIAKVYGLPVDLLLYGEGNTKSIDYIKGKDYYNNGVVDRQDSLSNSMMFNNFDFWYGYMQASESK